VENESDMAELLREIYKAAPGSHFYQPLDTKTKNLLNDRKKPE
jgi:hypothetical protein